ncbi:hypothetical protein KY321_02330 [Candidatus Woesearchaeota archaeon]|nr:hypothetical protein [Candidatus Woesearchaeota archaeon]
MENKKDPSHFSKSYLLIRLHKLRLKIQGLKDDNKSLQNDNTRLRKELAIWMKKSQENFRNSFTERNDNNDKL